MKSKLIMLIMGVCWLQYAFAQEDTTARASKISLDAGVDFVSSYVWRGLLVDATPNIQGWGELYAGPFTFGIWASSNFTGTYAESDLYASFTHKNFTLSITDYFAGNEHLFEFKKEEMLHVGELNFGYTLSESFPLQITAGTLIYGDDMTMNYYSDLTDPAVNSHHNYSTYIEMQYPISLSLVDLSLTVGGVTHESYFYDTEGAAIINIGVGISKTIGITDKFSLPLSFSAAINPNQGSLYSVLKVSL